MNEYASQLVGINDEDSCNNSGDGATRNQYTKRQAGDDMVNNKENSRGNSVSGWQEKEGERRQSSAPIKSAEIRHPAIAKHFID